MLSAAEQAKAGLNGQNYVSVRRHQQLYACTGMSRLGRPTDPHLWAKQEKGGDGHTCRPQPFAISELKTMALRHEYTSNVPVDSERESESCLGIESPFTADTLSYPSSKLKQKLQLLQTVD